MYHLLCWKFSAAWTPFLAFHLSGTRCHGRWFWRREYEQTLIFFWEWLQPLPFTFASVDCSEGAHQARLTWKDEPRRCLSYHTPKHIQTSTFRNLICHRAWKFVGLSVALRHFFIQFNLTSRSLCTRRDRMNSGTMRIGESMLQFFEPVWLWSTYYL